MESWGVSLWRSRANDTAADVIFMPKLLPGRAISPILRGTMTDNETHSLHDEPFFITKEAAQYLRLKPNTLEKMLVYGGGPVYRKHGGCVRYHIDDLTAWSDNRKKNSTSDE